MAPNEGATNTASISGDNNSGVQVAQNFGLLVDARSYHNQSVLSAEETSHDRIFRDIYSHVPDSRCPNYVERLKCREKIEAQLQCEKFDRSSKLVVLTGLGGAGKSQLALSYFQESGSKYLARFWIEAGSVVTIERDFTKIFSIIFQPEEPPADIGIIISRVHAWIQQGDGLRLAVFDGADEVDDANNFSFVDLRKYLPQLPGVHIIVTSRVATASKLTQLPPIIIGDMEVDEAVHLFRSCSTVEDQDEQIRVIVKELGYFALTVTVAAYYIAQDPELIDDVNTYLQEFRSNRNSVQGWCPDTLTHRYGKTLLSTWRISFKAIQRRQELAARLLTCLSFLSSSDIFLDLFRSPSSENTQNQEIFKDWSQILLPDYAISIRDLKNGFQLLAAYHFIQYDRASRSYSMHQLISGWTLDNLTTQDSQLYGCGTFKAIVSTIPILGSSWRAQRRLAPHLDTNFQALCKVLPEPSAEHLWVLDDCESLLELYREIGAGKQMLAVAEYRYRGLLAARGADHTSTLTAMDSLATVHAYNGNLERSIGLERQALEAKMRLFGLDNSHTLGTLNNLAVFLMSSGQRIESIKIQRTVLLKRQEMLGAAHGDTISAMQNLANSLHDSPDPSAREQSANIHEKIYQLRQLKFGPDHPDTITSASSLATVLLRQGNLKDAAALERTVLQSRRNALGNEHPATIHAVTTLAYILSGLDCLDEALILRQEAWEKTQLIYGPHHPETLEAGIRLVTALNQQARYAEACKLGRNVVSTLEGSLGKAHPSTLEAMNALRDSLEGLEDRNQAEVIASQVHERSRDH